MHALPAPKIYTRTGDRGYTVAPLAGRVEKTHPCVEAVGDLDEAESLLALAAAKARADGLERIASILEEVQALLFRVGFQLWEEGRPEKNRRTCVGKSDVERIEKLIDELLPSTPRLFTLHPSDETVAAISLARAVVRRAERRLWACMRSAGIEPSQTLLDAMALVNRLSDLLYAVELRAAEEKRVEVRRVTC